jgi:flagellar hook-basal body complex protein FliE
MSDIDISQAISQLQAMAAAAQGQVTPKTDAGNTGEFGALLKSAIENVNDIQQQAGKVSDSFAKGDPQTDLTEVMVALQKAKISFQAMVEVRNKLVVAYQDVMNMQI